MNNESMKKGPIAKFSVTEEEIKKVREEAEKSGGDPDQAEKNLKEKFERANTQRSNFRIVKDGERGIETEEERYKRIRRETEKGIEENFNNNSK
jgi:hypothetical protein